MAGAVDWELLLNTVVERVREGDLAGAAAAVEPLFTDSAVWRVRAGEALKKMLVTLVLKRGLTVSWEGVFGQLIAAEVRAVAQHVAEQLGYPPVLVFAAGSVALAGCSVAKKYLLRGDEKCGKAGLLFAAAKGAKAFGWSEEEAERWVALGVAVTAYLSLNPGNLEKEVEALTEGLPEELKSRLK